MSGSRLGDDRAKRYSGAIKQALDDNGVSRAYEKLIFEYLTTPDREPAYCCNGGCDPCISALERTVERARGLIQDLKLDGLDSQPPKPKD